MSGLRVKLSDEERRLRARERCKQWREANPNYHIQWRKIHRESENQKNKQWRKANPEYRRQYYETHREHEIEMVKQWQENNRECCYENNKQWRKANPEKNRGYKKQWREANPEYGRQYYLNIRIQFLQILTPEYQQPSCAQCGQDDIGYLEAHHIYHDGKEDRERFDNDPHILMLYYIDHPEEAKKRLQILCTKCHRAKLGLTLKMRKRMAEVLNNTLDDYVVVVSTPNVVTTNYG